MIETTVTTDRVRGDISDLVNRVTSGRERFVLTSDDGSQAALVSMADYAQLRQESANERQERWKAWLEKSRQLSAKILERRQGEYVDVEAILQANREDLEDRNNV